MGEKDDRMHGEMLDRMGKKFDEMLGMLGSDGMLEKLRMVEKIIRDRAQLPTNDFSIES